MLSIILIDELFTCDSSRFWKLDTYENRFNNSMEPEKFDKDAVRDYIKSICDPYTCKELPEIPSEKIQSVFNTYLDFYERLVPNGKNLLSTFDSISDTVSDTTSSKVIKYNDTRILQQYFQSDSPLCVILSGSPKDSGHIDKITNE